MKLRFKLFFSLSAFLYASSSPLIAMDEGDKGPKGIPCVSPIGGLALELEQGESNAQKSAYHGTSTVVPLDYTPPSSSSPANKTAADQPSAYQPKWEQPPAMGVMRYPLGPWRGMYDGVNVEVSSRNLSKYVGAPWADLPPGANLPPELWKIIYSYRPDVEIVPVNLQNLYKNATFPLPNDFKFEDHMSKTVTRGKDSQFPNRYSSVDDSSRKSRLHVMTVETATLVPAQEKLAPSAKKPHIFTYRLGDSGDGHVADGSVTLSLDICNAIDVINKDDPRELAKLARAPSRASENYDQVELYYDLFNYSLYPRPNSNDSVCIITSLSYFNIKFDFRTLGFRSEIDLKTSYYETLIINFFEKVRKFTRAHSIGVLFNDKIDPDVLPLLKTKFGFNLEQASQVPYYKGELCHIVTLSDTIGAESGAGVASQFAGTTAASGTAASSPSSAASVPVPIASASATSHQSGAQAVFSKK